MLLSFPNRFSFMVLFSSCCLVIAQLFPQTTAWRKPLITLSYDDRLSLAQDALNVTRLSVSLGENGDVTHAAGTLYALSEFDRRSGSSTFQDSVTAQLVNFSNTPNFTQRQRLGLAYYSAHLAYPETPQSISLLNTAKTLWDIVASSYISQSAATAGSLSGLGQFNSTCPSPFNETLRESVAGAVSFSGPPSANGETIGPWITLASRLYISSTNTTYTDYAAASIQFAKTFLSNGTMVFDTYDFKHCLLTGTGMWTYNGGYFLQGLSAYYLAIPSAATAQELEYLNELAASLVLSSHWTESDGINIEDAFTNSTADIEQTLLEADWKSIFVEGLYQCLEGQFLNDTVANLTRQYISVQYNAVRELANYTVPNIDTQVYGLSWNGVSKNLSELNFPGQLAASELFVTALGVGPPRASASTAPVWHQTRTDIGAVVGGTIGGVVALMGLLIAIFIWRRRKRLATVTSEKEGIPPASSNPEPYLATMEQYPIAERRVAFAGFGGDPGYLTKRQRTPLNTTPASSNVTETVYSMSRRVESFASTQVPLEQSQQRERDGTVRVDADALERLLHTVREALPDIQRRENRHVEAESLSTIELPPYLDSEGSSRPTG